MSDIGRGEIAWKHKNGTVRDVAPMPLPAGGHGSIGTKPGDYVIAYALPES